MGRHPNVLPGQVRVPLPTIKKETLHHNSYALVSFDG